MDAVPFVHPSADIPLIVLEARIEQSEPVRVLLDTGAAAPFDVMISPSVAARLPQRPADARTAASTGAVGSARVSFTARPIREFSLGGHTFRNLRGGVTQALDTVSGQLRTRIDAIIGYHFLERRSIAIDYRRLTVDLEAVPGPAARALPFTLASGRPLTLVRVSLNGRGPFLFALDTGASATLVSPATAELAGIAARGEVRLAGAGGASAGGARIAYADIAFGHVSHADQRIAIADVLGPVRAAAGAPIDGILGADFLRPGRLVIDYGARLLWLDQG
ncbi:MAG: pepsin/retropepsin-like aspartic protease family protein [Sphingosinicella sp.]